MSERDADRGIRSLAGCRVAITRERAEPLGELLRRRGATVVHVPLIEVVDAADGGAALRSALADPDGVDWVLVTSAAGVDRAADAGLAAPEARARVRVGCVGTATAARVEVRTGRPAELVPDRQLAAALADRFVELHRGGSSQRVVVAHADRAGDDLAVALDAAGHRVHAVTAYRTRARRPTAADLAALADVDAVLFLSGSAATSWVDEVAGLVSAPPLVVSVGPSTTAVAVDAGLKVTSTAADHSVPGIVAELESLWGGRPGGSDRGGPVAE